MTLQFRTAKWYEEDGRAVWLPAGCAARDAFETQPDARVSRTGSTLSDNTIKRTNNMFASPAALSTAPQDRAVVHKGSALIVPKVVEG